MMSLDEIEQIMDDTREGIDHQRVKINLKWCIYFYKIFIFCLFPQKIDELISGEFSNEDMDEINAELDEIVASTLKLPDVPQDNLNIGDKIRNNKSKGLLI